MTGDLPVMGFADLASWEAWLAAHGTYSSGVWMKLSKGGAPEPTIGKKEAIEGALCYGWIDGQIGKLDDHYFLTRFTPRRARSKWSLINRETAERLMASDRMKEPGLAEVERAKADGRWDAAYAPPSRAEPPADLLAALAANPAATRVFDGLDGANRYAILYRIEEAKRPQTRTDRIRKFVEMLSRGETIHPRKARGE